MVREFKNMALTVVENDCLSGASRKVMAGMMTIDEKGKKVRFAEAAPRPMKTRNIKLYDGPFLSVVRKVDGTMVMHSKAIDPSTVEDFSTKMLQEAIGVQLKMNELKKG